MFWEIDNSIFGNAQIVLAADKLPFIPSFLLQPVQYYEYWGLEYNTKTDGFRNFIKTVRPDVTIIDEPVFPPPLKDEKNVEAAMFSKLFTPREKTIILENPAKSRTYQKYYDLVVPESDVFEQMSDNQWPKFHGYKLSKTYVTESECIISIERAK